MKSVGGMPCRSAKSGESTGLRGLVCRHSREAVGQDQPDPAAWFCWPNSDGSSSATIRSSDRNSVWDTLKDAAGAVSITMHRSPLLLTASWSGSGVFFSSARRVAAGSRSPPSATTSRKRLHAPQHCRLALNDTTCILSLPCSANSPRTWPAPCPDAPAACATSYNTVAIGGHRNRQPPAL